MDCSIFISSGSLQGSVRNQQTFHSDFTVCDLAFAFAFAIVKCERTFTTLHWLLTLMAKAAPSSLTMYVTMVTYTDG